ncbi:hypothetical protein DFH08DRAFT_1081848 [Mycena albidolilacea]|uniref:Uncharacterized protein n=1 Tax=Mycena albidolilacea TaxID=1033008 RepID=A0AAD7EN92_9AGAR|nr:hypothetical protein DFH08DRAFT_1081848 [Mycena albidolilacea]
MLKIAGAQMEVMAGDTTLHSAVWMGGMKSLVWDTRPRVAHMVQLTFIRARAHAPPDLGVHPTPNGAIIVPITIRALRPSSTARAPLRLWLSSFPCSFASMFLFPSFRSQLAPDTAALTLRCTPPYHIANKNGSLARFLGPAFVASDRKAAINGLAQYMPQAAPALPPHSFVPPHARPPCIPDIAPDTALHFTLASATPDPSCRRLRARYLPHCALDGSLVARRSSARFPPPCALPPPVRSISLPVRPLPAAPALHPHLMRTRYSLPPPHLGPRYLHYARPMVAVHSLRLRACFPPLPRSIPTPCARSLAAALDLCRVRARYSPLPCLFPATYRFSARRPRSRFLPDALSLCTVQGLVSCPRLCARCTLASAASDVHFLSVFATLPLAVCPLNLFPVDGGKPGRIRAPL